MNRSNLDIAMIAHDGKKPEILTFLFGNNKFFQNEQLYATVTTGNHIAQEGFNVSKLLSGPLGGQVQIATKGATGALDLIFSFSDSLGKHSHQPDMPMFMRQFDVYNIPLATIPKTAHYILLGISQHLNSGK